MDDPFAYLYNMLLFGEQQETLSNSIFDTWTFWIVVMIIIPVLFKFLLVASVFRSIKNPYLGNTDRYRPGPYGDLGPLFGFPAFIPKSQSEIKSDRKHAYKKWGTLLSALCISGGIFLFIIGVSGQTDLDVPAIGKIQDAAPGTILFVIGFLFWKQVQK